MASCGTCALTIEAHWNLMELWLSLIFVMWLVGPGTFVRLHPSICVGWVDPSQESPNCLLASIISPSICFILFLSPANLLIFLYSLNLYNLHQFLFCLIFAYFCFSPHSLCTSCYCGFCLSAIMWAEYIQKHTHTSKIMSNDKLTRHMWLLLWSSVEICVITSLLSEKNCMKVRSVILCIHASSVARLLVISVVQSDVSPPLSRMKYWMNIHGWSYDFSIIVMRFTFVVQWNSLKTIGCIAITFATDIKASYCTRQILITWMTHCKL